MENEEVYGRLHRAVRRLQREILRRRCAGLFRGTGIPVFAVNPVDTEQIYWLSEGFLASKYFHDARKISSDLSRGKLERLGMALCVIFKISDEAPLLFQVEESAASIA